jgi:putative endonuclease
MFYTYVLQSLKDNQLYIGWSPDLKKRVTDHNKGLVESTKQRRPLKLVYYEACLDKVKSLKREKYLKTGFDRNFLNQRI